MAIDLHNVPPNMPITNPCPRGRTTSGHTAYCHDLRLEARDCAAQ
eukprot:CAMPEP_0203890352 /NCGR_PEP_ID=MMETSP0359-20131031/33786_1 /ASSEMBLY_ACC=CAM_ASM_000338 /TAXON_ID=268821 /ORGANISM="Scrippsiella Hangoei, Strain SHTV-5" /LENGTH=44 /DNA_ID= /DNA_START= /DNA_END= /DNA_ORIENTATION=